MEPSTPETPINPKDINQHELKALATPEIPINPDKHELRALAIRNALRREEGDGLYLELAHDTLSGGHSSEAVKAAQVYLQNYKTRLNDTLEGKRDVKLGADDFAVAQGVLDEYRNPKNLLQKVTYPFVRLGIQRMGKIVERSFKIEDGQQNPTPSFTELPQK